MQRLILFDIDETILHSDGVGRRALQCAMSEIFGREIDAGVANMSGKTDGQICHEVLLAHGIEAAQIAAVLPDLLVKYVNQLEIEIANAKVFRLHDGVLQLIETLSRQDWAHLGLLTGNIERGARLKLKPFDLNGHFHFGAYGCDSHDRMELPAVANKRANEFYGKQFVAQEIVIIGDAVNDVLCAKGYGAKSLAVSTGRTPKQSLEVLDPDFLFDNLVHTDAVIEAIKL